MSSLNQEKRPTEMGEFLTELRGQTIEALDHAIKRMEQVEEFEGGERSTLPMCSAAIKYARKIKNQWEEIVPAAATEPQSPTSTEGR